MEGVAVEALIDSGACVSVIDSIFIGGMKCVVRGKEKGKCLRTADGSEFQMESDATARIRMGQITLDWVFQVSPKQLPASVILGWDIIRHRDMRLLPRQGLVKFFTDKGWGWNSIERGRNGSGVVDQ